MTESPVLSIPALSLVVLMGPSGAGKSTLARRLFAPSEIVSSDALRGMVRNDENDMEATDDAFEVLHLLLEKRLAAGLLTVVDATNVRLQSRAALLSIARRHHVTAVAIVLDVGAEVCLAHNRARPGRENAAVFVPKQDADLQQNLARGLPALEREGFRTIHVLRTEAEVAALRIERRKLPCDARERRGPFDLIGDVHGCMDELRELLGRLGYVEVDGVFQHPSRTAVFLGDLVDRGPYPLACLELALAMVDRGSALMVPGNHEAKLVRYLRGKNPKPTHGLAKTIEDIDALEASIREAKTRELVDRLEGLPSHLVLDEGRLVAAHAGMKQSLQLRDSGAVRAFGLYGDTNGEIDEYGLPVRANWALEYRGKAMVVYGHTPIREAQWLNDTICIDTGCVFGGKLTALRYPERHLVEVGARATYYESRRPIV